MRELILKEEEEEEEEEEGEEGEGEGGEGIFLWRHSSSSFLDCSLMEDVVFISRDMANDCFLCFFHHVERVDVQWTTNGAQAKQRSCRCQHFWRGLTHTEGGIGETRAVVVTSTHTHTVQKSFQKKFQVFKVSDHR